MKKNFPRLFSIIDKRIDLFLSEEWGELLCKLLSTFDKPHPLALSISKLLVSNSMLIQLNIYMHC